MINQAKKTFAEEVSFPTKSHPHLNLKMGHVKQSSFATCTFGITMHPDFLGVNID